MSESTGTRVPRKQGVPPRISGSLTITDWRSMKHLSTFSLPRPREPIRGADTLVCRVETLLDLVRRKPRPLIRHVAPSRQQRRDESRRSRQECLRHEVAHAFFLTLTQSRGG